MIRTAQRLPRLKWWSLIVIGWLALLARDELARGLDEIWPRAPWVSATVEILPPDIEGAPPVIRYRAEAHRALQSTVWTAVIYDATGKRLETRKGRGDYRRNPPPARPWAWDDFFRGFSSVSPAVPAGPFRICVSYNAVALSGATDHGPDWCSDLYPTEEAR